MNLIRIKFSNKIEQINIFLKLIMFNYLIGNCDCHGKNFSLVYHDSKILLSPLYDLVSTTIYPSLSTKMAMKMGSNYDISKISQRDFLKQAEILEIKNRFWINTIEDFSKKIFPAFEKIATKKELAKSSNLLDVLYQQIKNRLDSIS